MEISYYLLRKTNYDPEVPTCLDAAEGNEVFYDNFVLLTDNGYYFNGKLYGTLEELNEEFFQKIYIGTSSPGWHFLLGLYPEFGISNLEDWEELFYNQENYIFDENNCLILPGDMMSIITERSQAGWDEKKSEEEFEQEMVKGYCDVFKKVKGIDVEKTYEQILAENKAEKGVNGLWKHAPTKGIVYPKEKNVTYDCLIASF